MVLHLQNEPFPFIAVAIFIALLTIILIYAVSYFSHKHGKTIPLAPAGMLETIQNMSGPNAPWFLLDMAKQINSDIFRLSLPIPGGVYCVGCPITTREILLDAKTDKPKQIYKAIGELFGTDNIASRSNTPEWYHARKGVARAFSSIEINRMKRICAKHVDKWIEETLEPCIKNNQTFDPSIEMCRITFRIILEAGFEYDASDEEYEHFIHQMDDVVKEFASKQINNPFRRYYAPLLADYRNAVKSRDETQNFVRKVLDAYRMNTNKSSSNTIIRMIAENECFTSDIERVAELCVMIFAGHDTTGYTLSTTLILLAKHPSISEKLREELLSLEPSNWSRSQYLKNVITESQRLLPVVVNGPIRVTGRDIKCKDGSMMIPKGSVCFLPQGIPNRNEQIFKDAECFKPERWDSANEIMHQTCMPFALGKRNCVGQSLAVSELETVLPKLLAKYSFEIDTEGEIDFFLTLKYAGTRLKPSHVK